MQVLAKEKLKEKNIKWEEAYTDKTAFLKKMYEEIVGKGSYFRFEGKAPNGDEYYCVLSPAGIHKPKAEWFAGVRKLPATFSAGGKYFDTFDQAASYALDTWGVSTPKALKPYTTLHLKNISKKVDDWKEEHKEEEQEAKEKEKASKSKKPKRYDIQKDAGLMIEASRGKAMVNREPYQTWNLATLKNKPSWLEFKEEHPKVAEDLVAEAIKVRERKIFELSEKYNLDLQELNKSVQTFIEFHPTYGADVTNVAPYAGEFKKQEGRYGVFSKKFRVLTPEFVAQEIKNKVFPVRDSKYLNNLADTVGFKISTGNNIPSRERQRILRNQAFRNLLEDYDINVSDFKAVVNDKEYSDLSDENSEFYKNYQYDSPEINYELNSDGVKKLYNLAIRYRSNDEGSSYQRAFLKFKNLLETKNSGELTDDQVYNVIEKNPKVFSKLMGNPELVITPEKLKAASEIKGTNSAQKFTAMEVNKEQAKEIYLKSELAYYLDQYQDLYSSNRGEALQRILGEANNGPATNNLSYEKLDKMSKEIVKDANAISGGDFYALGAHYEKQISKLEQYYGFENLGAGIEQAKYRSQLKSQEDHYKTRTKEYDGSGEKRDENRSIGVPDSAKNNAKFDPSNIDSDTGRTPALDPNAPLRPANKETDVGTTEDAELTELINDKKPEEEPMTEEEAKQKAKSNPDNILSETVNNLKVVANSIKNNKGSYEKIKNIIKKHS